MKGTSFYSRKLHSLLGIIPLGLFILEHMLTNYSAFEGGKESFDSSVKFLNDLPLVTFLEIFGIFLPLLYHGVYGLYIAYEARNNVSNYSYGRNIMFMLQRVTGVVTFVFIVWHLYSTRFQVTLGNLKHEDLGPHMNEILSQPVYFILYIIGVVAAVFHFSNGLWSFLVSWGITVGPRAQRVSSYICMGVFVLVSLLFILSLVAFTGSDFEAAGLVNLATGMING